VEWVYTGLGPLLLRDVLQSKKGVAAPLAVLASCVAARLGVPLLPAPPGHGLGAGARRVDTRPLPVSPLQELAAPSHRRYRRTAATEAMWVCRTSDRRACALGRRCGAALPMGDPGPRRGAGGLHRSGAGLTRGRSPVCLHIR